MVPSSAHAGSAASAPGPLRLVDRIYLVGSGRLGLSLTDDHDCNVYLVDCGRASLLFDTGCGIGVDQILANIERCGASPVSMVIVSHAHADHAAGADRLGAALGAQVAAFPEVAEILEQGDEEAAGLVVARRAHLYPEDVRLRKVAVEKVLEEGSLEVGDLELGVMSTPGHAAGHASLVVNLAGRIAVLSGDLVFARGRVAVLATSDTDVTALGTSISRLAKLAPDVLLPGHCEPVLSGAATHLASAAAAFEAGGLPASLA